MQKVIMILLAVSALSFSAVAHAIGFTSLAEQVTENQKGYPSWYVGKELVPGDSFTYHICDRTIKSTLNGATICYQARLDFVSLLQDHTGGIWIVQAVFTPDGSASKWPAILYIPEDFGTITTDGSSMNYATSLSHTLLYLQKYANTFKPQKLEIGSTWGFVDDYVSPVPQLTVTRFTSIGAGFNYTGVYEVGFDVVKDNAIYIKDGFPFPVEQTIYDSEGYNANPPVLYSLKLETNNVQNNVTGFIGIKELCPNSLLAGQILLHPIPSANNANQTQQLRILQNSTAAYDQNYTRPLNVTTEQEIRKELRSLGGNFTNSTQ